ncbi:hypothetical protein GPJ56_002199 [Histomonas meleagridis]|uniref:uncharacterized protein n=1 Tax=Histomonas meleagridis TaxID=135588 RepID=UPI0035595B31|nr:hypothetical protein GPJ56_002199 [Histomonas meleagridis]KAH0806621.1 hypothetical protein GO595_000472 [Histomonas meleagridis]
MEAFETEWKEDMPDKYRRPSQRLIELRKSAHNLALCGEFNEAQDLKNEAENLERKETEEAQRRLNKEYTIAKNRLIRKQKEEIRIFQENAEQQRIVLLSKRQIAEQASNNRKNVLNSKPSPKSRNSPQSKGSPTRLLGTRRSPSRSADRKLPPLIPPKEDTQKIKENSRKMEREIHSKKYREIHIEQDPYVHESESMSSRSD